MPKILIVDDSALMRRSLQSVFERAGGFVLETARDGEEAIRKNQTFEPDVVTLDINMPVMDGLTALAHIMATRPVPVVMLSSLTEAMAMPTLEALALGAVDYMPKPDGTISVRMEAVEAELVAKVRAAASSRRRQTAKPDSAARDTAKSPKQATPPVAVRRGHAAPGRLVLIGVSTGGPSTLEEILPALPADFPLPVVVAQHMPAAFTGAFANRMNRACALDVVEVRTAMEAQPGRIHIAMGGADLAVSLRPVRKVTLVPKPQSHEHLWHPSVEILGRSALEALGAEGLIAVMLTGMGHDGADSFADIRRLGGRTIAESEETAIVFGMPRELIQRGGAQAILPANRIAGQILAWAND